MLRFTLTQLMMATALVGIVVMFTQEEGCEQRISSIENIAFTSDGSRIAVSQFEFRAHHGDGNYNFSYLRRFGLLDVSNGKLVHGTRPESKVVISRALQTTLPHSPVVFDSSNNCFLSEDPVSGKFARYAANYRANWSAKMMFLPDRVFVLSRSGMLVAEGATISGAITVWDVSSNTAIKIIRDRFQPGETMMAFSDDERKLVVSGKEGISTWDFFDDQQTSFSVKSGWYNKIAAICIAPHDSIYVCEQTNINRYDFSGKLISTLSDSTRCDACCVSQNGRIAIFSDSPQSMVPQYYAIHVYDVASRKETNQIPMAAGSMMALSPDGKVVAVGDYGGKVSLYDVATGKWLWTVMAFSTFDLPYAWPGCCLVLWIVVAGRLWIKRRRNGVVKAK